MHYIQKDYGFVFEYIYETDKEALEDFDYFAMLPTTAHIILYGKDHNRYHPIKEFGYTDWKLQQSTFKQKEIELDI